jgi:hypothetical protein
MLELTPRRTQATLALFIAAINDGVLTAADEVMGGNGDGN